MIKKIFMLVIGLNLFAPNQSSVGIVATMCNSVLSSLDQLPFSLVGNKEKAFIELPRFDLSTIKDFSGVKSIVMKSMSVYLHNIKLLNTNLAEDFEASMKAMESCDQITDLIKNMHKASDLLVLNDKDELDMVTEQEYVMVDDPGLDHANFSSIYADLNNLIHASNAWMNDVMNYGKATYPGNLNHFSVGN